MKSPRYSKDQIVTILKELESGSKVAEICKKYDISEANLKGWITEYSSTNNSEDFSFEELESMLGDLERAFAEHLPEDVGEASIEKL